MNPWIAIIGTRQTGRSDVTHQFASALGDRRLRIAGFVSEPVERDDRIDGYDLVELPGGRRRPLARIGDRPRLCRWVFDERLFGWVRQRVAGADADVAILQVGTLEAAGDGLWGAIEAALAAPPRLVVLAIRPHVLVRVVDRLPEPAGAIELPATSDEVRRFVDDAAARAQSITGSRTAPQPGSSRSPSTT